MAVEITPLGFKKPDGNELVRGGDNVIADNAQTAQDIIAKHEARLANLDNAAGFSGDPLELNDTAVAFAVNGAGPTKAALNAIYAPASGSAFYGPKYATGATLTKTAGSWTIGLGDSLTDIAARERSYFEQTCLLSGQMVARLGNAGISGNTVQQMLARLDADVISKRPDRVLLKGGTNNVPTAQGYIDGQAAYIQILDRLLAAGIAVACVAIPPRTAAQDVKDRGIAWNAWVKVEAESRGLPFINTFPLFADGTGGWADLTNTTDGIHLTEKGAKLEGQFVANALAAYYPRLSENAPAQFRDPFNMLTNPLLTDASPADGTPDGWTKGGVTFVTAASATDPTILGKVARLTKSGAESGSLQQDISTGFRVGDTLGFSVKVRNPANMSFNIYLGAFTAANVFIGATYGGQSWGGTNQTWAAFGGMFTVPANTGYVRFVAMQFGSTAANDVIEIAEPAVRLVKPSAAISTYTPPYAAHSLGVTGITHRWLPDSQSQADGAAVPSLTDLTGTMTLAAMASGTRTMRVDALGKYVENSSVDNSGFQGASSIPAGAKTISMVVKSASGTLASYVGQFGGFNVARGGTGWQVYTSGGPSINAGTTASGNWEHLLFSWNGTTTGTAYFNGTAQGSTLAAEGTVSNTLLIKGAGQIQVREVATFDHAFTPQEVTDHRTALKAKWTDLP